MYNKLITWKHEPGKDFAFIIGDSVNFAQAKECDNLTSSTHSLRRNNYWPHHYDRYRYEVIFYVSILRTNYGSRRNCRCNWNQHYRPGGS